MIFDHKNYSYDKRGRIYYALPAYIAASMSVATIVGSFGLLFYLGTDHWRLMWIGIPSSIVFLVIFGLLGVRAMRCRQCRKKLEHKQRYLDPRLDKLADFTQDGKKIYSNIMGNIIKLFKR